jgi:glycosyltransferase involved in cell wall biosynthesis
VLLVPSTEEPFGRTVIEALAMNIPVIATSAGGPAEVIRPGLDGYTLPPDDLGEWVTAITRVLSQTTESSRSYAIERFSTERHAEQVLSVYQEVLSVAAPRRR